jgi:hypothetical protein
VPREPEEVGGAGHHYRDGGGGGPGSPWSREAGWRGARRRTVEAGLHRNDTEWVGRCGWECVKPGAAHAGGPLEDDRWRS